MNNFIVDARVFNGFKIYYQTGTYEADEILPDNKCLLAAGLKNSLKMETKTKDKVDST